MAYTRDPEPSRETVRLALQSAFPDQWEKVLKDMRWSSIDGCWYYDLYGMTVGIETDGYIHS